MILILDSIHGSLNRSVILLFFFIKAAISFLRVCLKWNLLSATTSEAFVPELITTSSYLPPSCTPITTGASKWFPSILSRDMTHFKGTIFLWYIVSVALETLLVISPVFVFFLREMFIWVMSHITRIIPKETTVASCCYFF
jgi:hypothetical protein